MTTEEKIAVMQAYVDGKKIQVKACCVREWRDCIVAPDWDWVSYDYRVKPEEKYRPYNEYHEMIDDFCERFGVNCPKYAMPLIWVKQKNLDYAYMIREFQSTSDESRMKYCLENYTYLDGSPVGKKVEEDG